MCLTKDRKKLLAHVTKKHDNGDERESCHYCPKKFFDDEEAFGHAICWEKLKKMPVEDILKKLGKDDFLENYYQERNKTACSKKSTLEYTSAKVREKGSYCKNLTEERRLENKSKKEKKKEDKLERQQDDFRKKDLRQKRREDAKEAFPNRFRKNTEYIKQHGRNVFTPNHQNPGGKYHVNSVNKNGSWNKPRENMPTWIDKSKNIDTLGSIGNRDDRYSEKAFNFAEKSQHSSANKKDNKYPDSDHEFYE